MWQRDHSAILCLLSNVEGAPPIWHPVMARHTDSRGAGKTLHSRNHLDWMRELETRLKMKNVNNVKVYYLNVFKMVNLIFLIKIGNIYQMMLKI